MEANELQRKNGEILYNDCLMGMSGADDISIIEYIIESGHDSESKLYAISLLIRDINAADSNDINDENDELYDSTEGI